MYMENATGQAIAAAIGDINLDTSGLAKDATLQAVNSTLGDIKDAITALSINELFIVKNYTYSWTWSSSGERAISITADNFNVVTPDGYTPIAISRISLGALYAYMRAYNAGATGTTSMIALYYQGSSTITATATISILYAKTGAIQ